VSGQSTIAFVRQTIADLVRLLRLWVTLGRELLEEAAGRLRKAAVLVVAGAVLVLFGALGLLAASAAALAILLPVWLSILIVAIVSAVTGALLAQAGVRSLKAAGSQLVASAALGHKEGT
jgi:membrane protein implicated in regulation of membrane protease activity